MKVVAITAEPGGEVAIRDRLTERNVPHLEFDVVSDPEHVFLNAPNAPKDIFVVMDHDWDVSGPYKMIQPALVVYDETSRVITECTWSWTTMGSTDGKWNDRVETQAWEGPIRKVLLVTLRPVMSDLLSAIQEKRAVKLASTHNKW